MNQELFEQVKHRRKLAVLADKNGNVLWESDASPVAALYQDYFQGKFKYLPPVILYAYQAGLAMAILSSRINISACHSFRMSACGRELFQKRQIDFLFEEEIPLVKSSKDETKVCPIELFLYEHPDEKEQWRFLKEKFSKTE